MKFPEGRSFGKVLPGTYSVNALVDNDSDQYELQVVKLEDDPPFSMRFKDGKPKKRLKRFESVPIVITYSPKEYGVHEGILKVHCVFHVNVGGKVVSREDYYPVIVKGECVKELPKS